MGSLSASVSSLLSALNIGAPKPAETGTSSGGAVDNFSSLLAIGNDAQTVRANTSEAANNNARPVKQPLGEKPETVSQLSDSRDDSPPKQEALPKEESTPREQESSPRKERSEAKEQAEAPANTASPRSERKSDAVQEGSPQPENAAPVTQETVAPAEVAPQEEPKDDTNDVVAAVDELYVLLLSIMRALGITPPEGAQPKVEGETLGNKEGGIALAAIGNVSEAATGQPQAAKAAEPLLPTNIPAATLNTDIELPIPLLEKIAQIHQAAQLIDDALASASIAATTASALPAASDATTTTPTSENAVFGALQALANKLAARNTPQAGVPVTAPEVQEISPAPELIKSGSQITSLLHRLAALFQAPARAPQENTPEEVKSVQAPLTSIAQGSPALSASGQQIAAQAATAPQTEPAATKGQEEIPAPLPAVAEAKINPATVTQPTIAAVASSTSVQAAAGRTGGESPQSGGGNSGQNAPSQSSAPAAATGQAQNASSAYKSDFARTLEQTQKNPVIEQVAFHIRTAKATGNSRISIQLNPHELGKVDVRIHIGDGGKTHVSITAESKNTLEILQRDAQGLARALSDAGLQTDAGSLSFNLRGGDQQQAGNGQEEGRSHGLQLYQKTQPEDDAEQALNTLSKSYVVNLADGLDIKI